MPVLLFELGAEYGRGRAVPQLHQLQQHGPELRVRLVEQPLVDYEHVERPVLADELALAARPLPALPPEVLEVGPPDVARPHPPCADCLRERAGEVGLARVASLRIGRYTNFLDTAYLSQGRYQTLMRVCCQRG